MRKNQVSLSIVRFGSEVPKGYPKDRMVAHIYTDSGNLYAALSRAYAKAVNVMEQWENVGVACEVDTNADEGIISETLGMRFNEFYNNSYINKEKLLGYLENSEAILKVVKSSSREDVRNNLHEKLGYTLGEANNILRINFGMMTAEDIEKLKAEIAEMKRKQNAEEKRREHE